MNTKFVLWLLILVFKFNVALLYDGTSYGSSDNLPINHDFQYTEKEADCLAWKFTLAATLYNLIEQTTITNMIKERRKIPDFDGYFRSPPDIYVDKIFPAKEMIKIIDTIIKKEGGFCSRELLYETHCPTHGNRGLTYDSYFHAEVKTSYFSQIMAISLDKDSVSDFDVFLRNHMSKSPETKASFYGLYCEKSCSDYFRYEFHNNFGLCMLAKHQKFLKKNNMFDFEFYNDKKNFHKHEIDKDSLKEFIKRSNEIAGEAADSQ